MNQLINMIMRLFMRKMVSKGIDVGINKDSKMGRKKQQPMGEIDDYGNATHAQSEGPSREEVRQARQAKRKAREQRQAVRAISRAPRI